MPEETAVSAIVKFLLLEDKIEVSKQSVRQFLKWYKNIEQLLGNQVSKNSSHQ